jgi:hypothetical protein
MLTSRRFVTAVLLLVTTSAVGIAVIDARLDRYDQYSGDHHPRKLFADERRGKYLLAMQNTPANFDSILVGTSISDSWDTSQIHEAKVYNASLSGGNASEERIILEKFLEHRAPKATFLVVTAYMTASHGQKEGVMLPDLHMGALGSVWLFKDYVAEVMERTGHRLDYYNESGCNRFYLDPPIPADRRATAGPGGEFAIDTEGLRDLRGMADDARRAGGVLIRVYPPVLATTMTDQRRQGLQHYWEQIEAVLGAFDGTINFNDPEFGYITGDRASFHDGVHLSELGGQRVIAELSRVLHAALATQVAR